MEKKVKELIAQGEGPSIEFKRTITSLEKIAKTISAFANSKGGTILVGVEDNGRLLGVNTEEEEYMLARASQFYCKPAVHLRYLHTEAEGMEVLLVQVPESKAKPHHCIDAMGLWRCYVRTGDKCLLAADTVLKAWKQQHDATQKPRTYTSNERMLMEYLGHRKKITVKDYAKLINVSKRRASRILLDLIRMGEIYEHDYNNVSYFTLAS